MVVAAVAAAMPVVALVVVAGGSGGCGGTSDGSHGSNGKKENIVFSMSKEAVFMKIEEALLMVLQTDLWMGN